MRRKKNIIIALLIGIVLIMTVVYAAFSSQLTINTGSQITSTWDVKITNIELEETTGTSSNSYDNNDQQIMPTYTDLTATFSADVRSPGDTITYRVTVTNKGTLKAKLIGCNWDSETAAIANTGYIRYSKACPATNSVVNPGSTQTIDITSTYYDDPNGQTQPTLSERSKSATLVLDYVQAE